jgi:thiol-disulfide isomerase/thioredoxin
MRPVSAEILRDSTAATRQSVRFRSKMRTLKMKHCPLSILHCPLLGSRKHLLSLALAFVCSITFGFATAFAQVLDLAGKVVEPLKIQGDKTIVLIFVRTDCPISNRYAPEINRLAEKYAAANVKLYLIYPGADETVETIRKHRTDYDYKLEALRDPQHQLVKTTGVKVTPEVAVFRADKQLYRGRIDNRFVAFGKMRPAPTTRDLQQVLEALRKGKPVTKRTTSAIGCFI